MIVKVYHNEFFTDYFQRRGLQKAKVTFVADVNCDLGEITPTVEQAMGMAFEYTNHIDHDWTTNPQVKTNGKEHRSTSVGDFMVVDKVWYIVDGMGWHKLSDAELKVIER
jgi:hypothetical protein